MFGALADFTGVLGDFSKYRETISQEMVRQIAASATADLVYTMDRLLWQRWWQLRVWIAGAAIGAVCDASCPVAL